MEKNKTNKKDNKKVKIVLRKIINIFCYVVTGLTFLLSIFALIGSCSAKSNFKQVSKINDIQKNFAVNPIDNYLASLPFDPILFDYRGNSQPTVTKTLSDDEYIYAGFYLTGNSIQYTYSLINDTNTYNSNFICLTTADEFYELQRVHSVEIHLLGGSFPVLDVESDNDGSIVHTRIGLGTSKRCFFFLNNCVLQPIPYDKIDNFYRYFTYECTLDYDSDDVPSDIGHIIERALPYYENNTYSHYFDFSGQFILNPLFDFYDLNLYIRYRCDLYDTYNMTIEDSSLYYKDGRRLHLLAESGERSIISDYILDYDNEWQYEQRLATQTNINGKLRYVSSQMFANTNTDPWQYSTDVYLFNFPEITPYQPYLDNFYLMFIPIENTGVINKTFQFEIYLYGVYKEYMSIFYPSDSDGYQVIKNYFNYSSDIYFNNVSWKSFTSRLELFSRSWVLEGFSYYPERVNYNQNSIYAVYMPEGQQRLQQSENISGNAIHVSDFYFFVYSGAFNFYLSDTRLDITTGVSDNIGLMSGVLSVFNMISVAVNGMIPFLSIEVSRGLTLGVLIFIPFTVSIIFIVLRIFKR